MPDTDPVADSFRHLLSAGSAHRAHVDAIKEFQAACARKDWEGAEAARVKCIATLEAHLDAMMAANRKLQSQDGKR